MKTKLIFPDYDTIYQYMNTIRSQEKTSLIPSEAKLSHYVAKALADKTLSEERAKTQMYKAITHEKTTTFTPCLGVVIDITLFAFLLECPQIQKVRSGDDACGSTQKKSFSLLRMLSRK